MTGTKEKLVCLICLKRFGREEASLDNNNEESDVKIRPFQPSASLLESNHHQKSTNLYSRFLLVASRYLKVAGSQAQLELIRKCKNNAPEKNVESFCDQCQVTVRKMCDLYAELQVVKLKLVTVVDELEQVARKSVKSVSTKLARGLFKSLAEQLNFRYVKRLELFRKSMVVNCHRKVKQNHPQLLVPRGLFPEHWMFTYSATRLALMRLLLVFALGAAPPTSNEMGIKTETKDIEGTVDEQMEYQSHSFDEKRTKKRAPSSKHQTNLDTENDESFSLTEGDDGDNDSDWSVDPGMQSPDSAQSTLDSNSEPDSVHEDSTISKKPSGLRKNRLKLKAICEENGDGEENTEDPHFTKTRNKATKKQQRNNGSKIAAPQDCKERKNELKEDHRAHIQISCAMCDFECKLIKELRDHERAVHPQHEKKSVQCNFCYKKFANKQSHYLHVQKTHFGPRSVFSCDAEKCDKIFKNHFDLNKHLVKFHLEDSDKPSVFDEEEDAAAAPPPVKTKSIEYCETCNWGFINPDLLAVHKLVHIAQSAERHKCPACERTYRRVPEVRKHYRSVHGSKRKTRKSQVSRKYCRDSENYFICTEEGCARRFKKSGGLSAHWKLHHGKEDLYLCSVCGARFGTNWHRNRHEQLSHGPPQFECNICHKSYKWKHHLLGHMLTHDSDPSANTFVCSECGSSFKSGQGLRFHILSRHTSQDEKNYSCTECAYKTHRPSLLKLHLKVCLRNKGLPCDDATCQKICKVAWNKVKALGFSRKLNIKTTGRRNNQIDKVEEEVEEEEKLIKSDNGGKKEELDTSFDQPSSSSGINILNATDVVASASEQLDSSSINVQTPENFDFETALETIQQDCQQQGEIAEYSPSPSLTYSPLPSSDTEQTSQPYKISIKVPSDDEESTASEDKERESKIGIFMDAHENIDDEDGGQKSDSDDSDWSAGAPSPDGNSDSAEESIEYPSSENEDDGDIRKESKTLPKPRPQRLQLGLVKVICEEDEGKSTNKHLCKRNKEKREQLKKFQLSTNKEAFNQCEICGKKFGRRKISVLIKHLWCVHKIIHQYKCSTCDFKCRRFQDMKDHEKERHSSHENIDMWYTQEEDSFQCKICKLRLRRRFHLKYHLKNVHRANFLLKCSICNFKAGTTREVKRHERVVHPKRVVKKKEKPPPIIRKAKGGPIKCQHCMDTFANQSRLTRHLKKIHKLIFICSCGVCGRKFKTATEMKLHKQTWHKKYKEYPCNSCSYKAKLWKELVEHKSKMHKRNTKDSLVDSTCAVCHLNCRSVYRLKKHLNGEHEQVPDEEKTVECNYCDLKFACKQTHDLHLSKSHIKNGGKLTCDAEKCNKRCKSILELNKHLKEEHLEGDPQPSTTSFGSEEPKLTAVAGEAPEKTKIITYCKICNWGFFNPDFLQLHVLVHTQVVEGVYPCPECEQRFPEKLRLKHHYNSNHGKQLKIFKCGQCPAKFSSRSGFDAHKKAHVEKERVHFGESGYKCDECGSSFVHFSTFRKHQKRHDTPNRSFTCPEKGCGQTFKFQNRMEFHMRKDHAKGELYPCWICGASFTGGYSMKKHVKDVHVEPQFECDVCHKKFKTAHCLRKHNGRIHKPRVEKSTTFMCSECGSIYKTQQGLKLHIRSKHMPEDQRRFSCPYCAYKQNRPHLFRMHMKTCLRNRGLPYDEEKWGKLPASTSNASAGGARKQKDKDEEEMEENTTTDEEENDDNAPPAVFAEYF